MTFEANATMFLCAFTSVIDLLATLDVKYDATKVEHLQTDLSFTIKDKPTSSTKFMNLLTFLCDHSAGFEVYYFLVLLKFAVTNPNMEYARVNFMNA